MTPLQAEILLWYYCRSNDYRAGDFSAPAVREAIDHFSGDAGMLQLAIYDYPDMPDKAPPRYKLTNKARVYVDHMLSANYPAPINMILFCPQCGFQHIDIAEDEDVLESEGLSPGVWKNPPHRSHLCAECGFIWRPADVPTNGVSKITTAGKADSWPQPYGRDGRKRWITQGDATPRPDHYRRLHLHPVPEPVHASDCALHNAPAEAPGPCDCGAEAALAEAISQPRAML